MNRFGGGPSASKIIKKRALTIRSIKVFEKIYHFRLSKLKNVLTLIIDE
jgi:hypothetical protein